MRVAVGVRVDRPLEPGDQLVGAPVDGPVAGCVALPAGHADRVDACARREAGRIRGPVRADQDARQLGPVHLHVLRVARLRLRVGERVARDDVVARADAVVQERVAPVDAGVEQRDRHAAAAHAGQADAEAAARPARRLRRRRVGGPYRVDAGHAGRLLDQCGRLGAEGSREAVHDAGVLELGPHADPVCSEVGDQLVLRGEDRRRPAALLALVRATAGVHDPLRERRRLQHDDHALAERDLDRLAAHEAVPRSRRHLARGRRRRLLVRPDGGDQRSEERRGECHDEEQRDLRARVVRPRMRTHPAKGSRAGPRTP